MNRSLKIGLLFFFIWTISIEMLHAQIPNTQFPFNNMPNFYFNGNDYKELLWSQNTKKLPTMLFDFTKEEREMANTRVNSIRQATLVVRLKSNRRQIEAYKAAGDIKTAEKIENRTIKTNLQIISSVIKFYNFGQVYFMDVEDKDKLISKDTLKFSRILFEKDTSIYLKHDSLYFLDYGYLYGRSQVNEWKYKDYGKTEENTSVISENAFVLRDANGRQLALPLPFYSVVSDFQPIRNKKKGQVIIDTLVLSGDRFKLQLNYLRKYIGLNSVNSNSIIENDYYKVNGYDAAISKLNSRLYYFFAKINNQAILEENPLLWIENNPNKYLYPLWINAEKKLLSIQEGQGGQFIKKF